MEKWYSYENLKVQNIQPLAEQLGNQKGQPLADNSVQKSDLSLDPQRQDLGTPFSGRLEGFGVAS